MGGGSCARLGLAAALWMSLLFAESAAAVESVTLQLLPAERALFESADHGYPCEPGRDEIAIVGLFNCPRFAAAEVGNVSLTTASGEAIPLLIDERSVLREFGRIISFRLCAVIPARLLENDKAPELILKWGDDVSGRNQLVAGFRLDPERAESYRGFVWKDAGPRPGDDGEPTKELTITLTAKRGAELHKYWYLIPLAVLFLLLSVRRILSGAQPPPAQATPGSTT